MHHKQHSENALTDNNIVKQKSSQSSGIGYNKYKSDATVVAASNKQLGSDGKASKNSEIIKSKNSERHRNARK